MDVLDDHLKMSAEDLTDHLNMKDGINMDRLVFSAHRLIIGLTDRFKQEDKTQLVVAISAISRAFGTHH
jgi:hypothetical protein